MTSVFTTFTIISNLKVNYTLMKKTLTNLLLFFVLITSAHAQSVITGNVKAKGDILGKTGVNVKVKGHENSTYTDLQGDFSITLPQGATTLIFVLDGFQTQEIIVGNRAVIDVEMNDSSNSTTNEGIITGYGTLDKNSNTGSTASIDATKLAQQPVVTLEQANQGRASGVLVQNSGGQLGAAASVLIRGGSSLTASNQPLYVVDGIPLTSGNQSDLNPNNVESIEVLKDASAIAIYGSRAANGVIVITTKNGDQGKVKFDADYQFGLSTVPRKLDISSPVENRILAIEFFARTVGLDISRAQLEALEQSNGVSGGPAGFSFPTEVLDVLSNNTDWQDEIFRTALTNKANVSASGGTKNFKYFGGLSYQNQEGIVIGNDFERFNAQANLTGHLSNKVSVSLNLSYAKSTSNLLPDDADLGNPLQAIVIPSAIGFDPSNSFRLIGSTDYNPLTEINFSEFVEDANVGIASLGLDYTITDNLSFNFDAGVDVLDQRTERRQGPETLDGVPNGFSRLSEVDVFNYIFNANFNYERKISDHSNLAVVLGVAYQSSTTDFKFRSAQVNSITELEGINSEVNGFTNNPVPSAGSKLASLFGRINYGINDKYIFQFTGRYDGSSRFGPSNQYGFFPAISGAWNISNEEFFSNVNAFSFLKLKASFGYIGNTPSQDFLSTTNYFIVNRLGEQGIRAENIANEDIKWEVTEQFDIGLDFGILKDRISGSINYYQKNTSDLLFLRPISPTSGVPSVIDNFATLTSNGVEFNVTSENVNQGVFKWSTSFNIATNNSTIDNLRGNRVVLPPSAFIEGESPGVFFLPRYIGVDPSNGRAIYDNGNGGTTTSYDDALSNGRQVIGDPNPDFFGGLDNTLSYKNFELNFLFQFVGGVDIYNQTAELFANSGFRQLGQRADQANRWYSPGDNAQFPVLDPANNDNTRPSSRFLEDGSYIRLNNLTLSYNLPAPVLSSLNLRSLSFYIGGQNLFTITDYSGYDPDVNSVDPLLGSIGANLLRNIDNFTAPQSRTFITGIKIGF